MNISKRAQNAPESPIRKLAPLAEKAKKAGIKIYYLNIGQPDFEMPPKVHRSLLKYANDSKNLPYTSSQGEPSLLLAWQKYYADINIKIDIADILITTGASEALQLVFAALCDPGDEILTFEPFYANYLGFAGLVSVKLTPALLDEANGYHLPSIDIINKKITPKTKAILLTNPNNPTGTVFTRKEIQTIIDIAEKHGLFVIADETYFGLVFDDNKPIGFYHVANKSQKERIIIIDSLSKRLNLCGARLGVIISKNINLMSALNRFAQARLSVGTMDQVIAVDALSDCIIYIQKIASEYQKRRNAFIDTLSKELNIDIHYPEGAFYAMVKLPIKDTEKFASWLLTDFRYNNSTVMVAPGSGFYASDNMGKNEIRIAYVLNPQELKTAAKILAHAVRQYHNCNK